MSIAAAFTLLGVLALMASGANMVLRPRTFLGQGISPATDPRTVRAFGIFFLVLGTAAAVLTLIKFVSE